VSTIAKVVKPIVSRITIVMATDQARWALANKRQQYEPCNPYHFGFAADSKMDLFSPRFASAHADRLWL